MFSCFEFLAPLPSINDEGVHNEDFNFEFVTPPKGLYRDSQATADTSPKSLKACTTMPSKEQSESFVTETSNEKLVRTAMSEIPHSQSITKRKICLSNPLVMLY